MYTSDRPNPYDVIADDYDKVFGDQNLYYGPISRCEREVFDEWAPPVNVMRDALDIGCGTGFHTRWLADRGYNTVGIDISGEMLRVAENKSSRWRNRPRLFKCDALELDELSPRDKQFDLIICLGSTLNHIPDWATFSKLVSSRLRRGGRFVFSYDNFLGVDTLLWLFKRQRSGYRQEDRGRNFCSNIQCLFAGRPYQNHWIMEMNGINVEVPLSYERSSSLKRYLTTHDLRVKTLRGVHLLSCFRRQVLEASACLQDIDGQMEANGLSRMMQRFETWLRSHMHFACANTIGAAVKT